MLPLSGVRNGGFQKGSFGGCSWTPKTERGYNKKTVFPDPKGETRVQKTERLYKPERGLGPETAFQKFVFQVFGEIRVNLLV